MGIGQGPATSRALAAAGIRHVGWRWQWQPGRQGKIFEPHQRRDNVAVWNVEGFVGDNAAEWGALPGQGINEDHCMCSARMLLRGADGRFQPERESQSAPRTRDRS